MNTTAQLEMTNAKVQKGHGLGNQQPSTDKVKVQRLGVSRTCQVARKCKAPEMGEDIV